MIDHASVFRIHHNDCFLWATTPGSGTRRIGFIHSDMTFSLQVDEGGDSVSFEKTFSLLPRVDSHESCAHQVVKTYIAGGVCPCTACWVVSPNARMIFYAFADMTSGWLPP